MDWSKGYSARYYVTIVDPLSWRDGTSLNITGGSIKKSDSDLLESADLNFVNYAETKEQYLRVWLDAKQGNSSSHTPLFTGLATSPARDINGHRITNTAQCYSVLKPAQDVLLQRGWYAPYDTNAVQLVRELLKVCAAPVVIEDEAEAKLEQAIIAENNENHLSMTWKILSAIKWRIKIGGDGTITVCPQADPKKGSSAVFDSLSNDILEPTLSVEYDWYECPNVFRAVMDNTYAVARDDDPDNPFSTVTRGREVWAEETNCNLNENETIAQYAQRRLKELQKVSMSINYDRRFIPDVTISDIISLNYPAQKITGQFVITSQNIDLGYSARTSEEVYMVV